MYTWLNTSYTVHNVCYIPVHVLVLYYMVYVHFCGLQNKQIHIHT